MAEFQVRSFDDLGTRELYEIMRARSDVFVGEEEILYPDADGLDYESMHVFSWDGDGRIASYLRMFPKPGEPGVVQMGRVLTRVHGLGLGRELFEKGVEVAVSRLGAREIYVESQKHAEGFYLKAGFETTSGEFIEAGTPHVEMRRRLPASDAVQQTRTRRCDMQYEVQWEEPGAARTLDVSQVVDLEQAVAADGTSLAELMDRAGASVAQFVEGRWSSGSRVAVFCGKGNNGGDGWVTARLLAEAGYDVRVVTPCVASEISAHPAREAASECMEEVHASENLALHVLPDEEELRSIVGGADVVIDGMLGTGFHYESLHEPTASWVAALSGVSPVVAIDVPSGLNAQTGDATDPAVRADFTVTMMALKTGLATETGQRLCGEIHVARIADIEKYL